jgi:hypothetical protein
VVSDTTSTVATLGISQTVKAVANNAIASGSGGVGGGEEKKTTESDEISAEEARVRLLAEQRHDMTKRLAETNADLAAAATALKQSALQDNDLAKAVKSLTMVTSLLFKVKTLFENCKLFWEGVRVRKLAHAMNVANTYTVMLVVHVVRLIVKQSGR